MTDKNAEGEFDGVSLTLNLFLPAMQTEKDTILVALLREVSGGKLPIAHAEASIPLLDTEENIRCGFVAPAKYF